MARVDNSIDIQAPGEKVFAYIADLSARPQWVKWAKSVEVTSREKEGVGTTDRMVIQVVLRKEHVEGVVTEYTPGRLVAHRLTKGMDLTERLSVADLASGAKVNWAVEYTPPLGLLGKIVDFLLMATLMDQLMKDSLLDLKEEMESR